MSISQIEIHRLQAAKGYVQWAYTYQGGSGVVPGNTFSGFGGNYSSQAVITATTTQVTSAAISSAGAGGTPGTQTVVGSTGTGTKFQANVTISSSSQLQSVNYILVGGAYTVNPSNLTSEPITGGGLSGASLAIQMGAKDASVTSGGIYTKAANGIVSPTSTSGSGIGQQFWLTFGGPSDIHFEDVYFAKIEDNAIGSIADWNGITIDGNLQSSSENFLRRNHIQGNINDGIFIYGIQGHAVGDTFIQDQNDINHNGRAGVEFFQNVQGAFIDGENLVYLNDIGVIADVGALAVGSVNDIKIRGNDIDSNNLYTTWFHGLSSSMYQHNWSNGAKLVCILFANIQFDELNVENPNGGISLLGSVSIEGNGSIFSSVNNAISIGSYQGTASQWISFTGNLMTFANAGVFMQFQATPPLTDYVTVGAQLWSNELLTAGPLPTHLKTQ